jgi:hypothetical protein
MSTEIVCYPETMAFGGVAWTRTDRAAGTGIEYLAKAENKTQLRVYLYPQAPERWLWKATFDVVEVNYRLAHYYEVGVIVDSMEEAMTCAINAFDDWLDDMQRILRQQRPKDGYALGFEDGQAALKAEIEKVLL